MKHLKTKIDDDRPAKHQRMMYSISVLSFGGVMPRMILAVMILVSFAWLSHGQQQDESWRVLRVGDDYTYYINPKTTVRTPQDTFKVWIKYVVAETNKKELNKKVWWKYDYMLELQEYDCAQRRTLLVEIVGYDAQGNLIDHMRYNDKKGTDEWKNMVPGSVGESVLESVCAVSKKQQ